MWKLILFLGILLVGFSFGIIVSKSGLDFSEGKILGVSVIGIVGILISLYKWGFLKRQTAAQEESNRLTEKEISRKQFNTAIEHLSSDDELLRIFSFQEFFRLARDNKEDYGQSVVKILCTHLRQKTNYGEFDIQKKPPYTMAKDVHSEEVRVLVDVLFGGETGDVFDGLSHDLSHANLTYLDFQLKGGKRKINFSYANLGKAKFNESNISGCIFEGSSLLRAEFRKTNLHGVNFSFVNLEQANFEGADFSNAIFYLADISRANLSGAKFLEKADWRIAFTEGTNFPEGFDSEKFPGLQYL